MNNSSYYTDMIKKQIESIPNDSNIILSKDDFIALTKFIQDVLEEFWNDHINGTAQMNNEEEEKVIKVAIKVFMEHKLNSMISNNTEMVEQNQMNDDCNDNDNTSNSRDTDQHVDKIRNNIDSNSSSSNSNSNSNSIIRSDINNELHQPMDVSTVQSHSISSSREDPDVCVGNVTETNTVNDNDNHNTDQQVDMISCDNNNSESDRNGNSNSNSNSNSVSLIATDIGCGINNDFHQSMDIESHSNDGKDADADTDIGNAMDDAINMQAAVDNNVNNTSDMKVDNDVNTTASIDHSSVSQCECGMRFLSTKFLFYHRRDKCKLWVGHHKSLTDSANCKLPPSISTGLNSSNSIGKRDRLPKSSDDDDDDDDFKEPVRKQSRQTDDDDFVINERVSSGHLRTTGIDIA